MCWFSTGRNSLNNMKNTHWPVWTLRHAFTSRHVGWRNDVFPESRLLRWVIGLGQRNLATPPVPYYLKPQKSQGTLNFWEQLQHQKDAINNRVWTTVHRLKIVAVWMPHLTFGPWACAVTRRPAATMAMLTWITKGPRHSDVREKFDTYFVFCSC